MGCAESRDRSVLREVGPQTPSSPSAPSTPPNESSYEALVLRIVRDTVALPSHQVRPFTYLGSLGTSRRWTIISEGNWTLLLLRLEEYFSRRNARVADRRSRLRTQRGLPVSPHHHRLNVEHRSWRNTYRWASFSLGAQRAELLRERYELSRHPYETSLRLLNRRSSLP